MSLRNPVASNLVRQVFPLAAMSVYLAACDPAPTVPPTVPDDAEPVTFAEIEGATRILSGFLVRVRLVIRDETEFREFWSKLEGQRSPKTEPPVVDFAQNLVVVAAMGGRGTTGYSIIIEGVYEEGQRLFVAVHERTPHSDCVVGQAVTWPVTAVAVTRTLDEVVFVERETVYKCE